METAFIASSEVDYTAHSVVSKTIMKKPNGTVTLFAFDKGEELSEHTASFEALVHIMEGEAEIIIGGKPETVTAGRFIMLPANVPHAVKATQQFKMMLTMIKS